MSAGHEADELAAKAAESVREILTEAEARAASIVREAEAEAAKIRERVETEAAGIRERAEADARAQIEAAKRALDELGGTLVAAATEAIPGAESQPADPEPAPEPEPTPAPEPEQVVPPAGNGDDAAARLVAMKLAVDGRDRAEIESELTAKFGAADRSALLDDVLARISR